MTRLGVQLAPPEIMDKQIRQRRFWLEIIIGQNGFTVVEHKISLVTVHETCHGKDEDYPCCWSEKETRQGQTTVPLLPVGDITLVVPIQLAAAGVAVLSQSVHGLPYSS